jgi:putative tricarboxylic transport membrane protein
MDVISNLFQLYGAGLHIILQPLTIGAIALGVLVGVLFGALPGLSSTMALALFTPLTFGMSPEVAIAFLIAVYVSSVYAGALAAILVNIPGTPSAIATALDGYPMSQRGETGRAIGLATGASVLGGVVGLVVLMLFSPLMAQVARQFGTWEYAVLAVMGLTLVAYVSPGSTVRGLIGGAIGLLIATIGRDPITAWPRFTGGTAQLAGGIDMIVLMIGFFGFAELFSQLENTGRFSVRQKVHGVFRSFGEVLKRSGNVVRSALVGVGIGILPGAGGSIASIAAYGVAKRLSKDRESFGKGSAEGLTAAESSNNASVGGALVPMMTLGIPGDPMTAVLIGALLFHGLSPGPALFTGNPQFVSAIYLSFLMALVFILIAGLIAARPLARMMALPRPYIMAFIALLCVIGAYAIQNNINDVFIAIAAGVVGYLLNKVDVHPAPIILGMVLGPLLEANLRRSILLADGSFMPYLTRPVSAMMLAVIVLVLAGPPLYRLIQRLRGGA